VRFCSRATRSARSRKSSSSRIVNGFLCVTVAPYRLRCSGIQCMTLPIRSQGQPA
jgi:hypothetical protein